MDLLSMASKTSPALQNLLGELGNFELIYSYFASVAQVCKEDNFSGLENKYTGLIGLKINSK